MHEPQSVVEWAYGWFTHPSSEKYPASDRAWLFIAAVALIGSGINNSRKSRRIHDIFTYLLRGWNPVTAWVKHSVAASDTRLLEGSGRECIKVLMDFEQRPKTSERYTLLSYFSQAVHQTVGAAEKNEFYEERKTLLALAVWLLGRRKAMCPPRDVVVARACLDLYHRCNAAAPGTALTSYYTDEGQVYFSSWLEKQIELLLVMSMTASEFEKGLDYVAWFSCLMRAGLMLRSTKADDAFVAEVEKLTQANIDVLYAIINSSPLTSEDPAGSFCTNRLLRLFGWKNPRRRDIPTV